MPTQAKRILTGMLDLRVEETFAEPEGDVDQRNHHRHFDERADDRDEGGRSSKLFEAAVNESVQLCW